MFAEKKEFHKEMKHGKKIRLSGRQRRAQRIRKKVFGNAEKPRLSVYRSLNNIYVQLIDDENNHSILGASSLESKIREQKFEGGKIDIAKAVGKLAAEKAKEKGVKQVVFDRGGYLYHGRVRAVAEGAREGGLNL